MSGGLVTSVGADLNSKYGTEFSALERVSLIANGNLQRMFSSFYDAPVSVVVKRNTKLDVSAIEGDKITVKVSQGKEISIDKSIVTGGDKVWDRIVLLNVYDKTFCKCTSIVHVRDAECIRLVEEGKIGIGQLFRHLNKLSEFTLVDAGRIPESEADKEDTYYQGGVWRIYEMKCEELTCLIYEELPSDAWELKP